MMPTLRAINGSAVRAMFKYNIGMLAVAALVTAVWTMSTAQSLASLPHLELTLAAVFVAGIIASVAGFAFSAIAGALLAHLHPEPVELVRILLVCSITIQAYCTAKVLRNIRWSELAPYIGGGLLTVPIGIFLLTRVSSVAYARGLGLLLVIYGVYSLCKPLVIRTERNRWLDAVVGGLGGITGGLAAFPGAFAAIWCSARGLSKDDQRAICQPYIFCMQIATLLLIGQVQDGISSLGSLWLLVPVSLLSASVGFRLFSGLSNSQFRLMLLTVLITSGSLLIFRS